MTRTTYYESLTVQSFLSLKVLLFYLAIICLCGFDIIRWHFVDFLPKDNRVLSVVMVWGVYLALIFTRNVIDRRKKDYRLLNFLHQRFKASLHESVLLLGLMAAISALGSMWWVAIVVVFAVLELKTVWCGIAEAEQFILRVKSNDVEAHRALSGLMDKAIQKTGVHISRFTVIKIRGGACVLTFPPRKRMVAVSENLLKTMTEEEALAIILHEFGHVKYAWLLFFKPVIKVLFSAMALWLFNLLLGASLENCRDFYCFATGAVFATIAVIYIAIVAEIVARRARHWNEYLPDLFAVRQIGDSELFIRALKKAAQNIPVLSKIFSNHPSLSQRIAFIRRHCRGPMSPP